MHDGYKKKVIKGCERLDGELAKEVIFQTALIWREMEMIESVEMYYDTEKKAIGDVIVSVVAEHVEFVEAVWCTSKSRRVNSKWS